jgi:hypothetical protein
VRCKHKWAARCTYPGRGPNGMETRECPDCEAWLSLGESNDDSEAVRVEMRAAELAANDGPIRTCDNAMPKDCEECGWDCWPFPNAMHDASPAQWGGYLARQITTHKDEEE